MRSYRHAVVLGGLGGATGAVTWTLVEVIADWFGESGDMVVWLGPGLAYGLAVAGYLQAAVRHAPLRHAALVAGMVLSWNLAVRLAVEVYEATDLDVVAGVAGGLLGALVVAGVAALAYPALRRSRGLLPVVAAGTLCGALLALDREGGLLLYVVWQGAVAAAIGLALDREPAA